MAFTLARSSSPAKDQRLRIKKPVVTCGSFSKALKRGRQHLRTPRHKEERTMNLNAEVLNPLVALIAGILILIMPRLLNYVVAIYLIVIGILGFSHHFHI